MPRRRCLRRFPSFRNLQVYHEVAFQRRTQTAVAPEFKVSQVRISQICRQTQAWVDCLVPARFYLGQPGLRFHLAVAHERLRLQQEYGPLLEMFLGDDGQPRFLKRSITVVSGEPLHTVEVTEQHNFRLLNQAADVQGRLVELEAIANRGPFADVPAQIKQTIVRRYGPRSDKTSASPAEPLSNCSVDPSNPLENRGGGVLNECPPQSSPTAELESSVEFAVAGSALFDAPRAGTESC